MLQDQRTQNVDRGMGVAQPKKADGFGVGQFRIEGAGGADRLEGTLGFVLLQKSLDFLEFDRVFRSAGRLGDCAVRRSTCGRHHRLRGIKIARVSVGKCHKLLRRAKGGIRSRAGKQPRLPHANAVAIKADEWGSHQEMTEDAIKSAARCAIAAAW